MVDAIGNKINKGSLIMWKQHGLIFEVREVVDPADARIKLASGAEPVTPYVILQIAVPFTSATKGEIVAGDFFALVNPAHTDAIDQMMKGRQVTQ